jgi:antitoxin component of MazEF toxin-antitoxin module
MNKVQRTILKNSRTSRISLPLEYLAELGIELKEVVNVELVNGTIVISKIECDK